MAGPASGRWNGFKVSPIPNIFPGTPDIRLTPIYSHVIVFGYSYLHLPFIYPGAEANLAPVNESLEAFAGRKLCFTFLHEFEVDCRDSHVCTRHGAASYASRWIYNDVKLWVQVGCFQLLCRRGVHVVPAHPIGNACAV